MSPGAFLLMRTRKDSERPMTPGIATRLTPLPVTPAQPRRLTPTDISQFIRLRQCERFLRLRLAERAGQRFMEAYGVGPQRIAPLLTLSGSQFEQQSEAAAASRFPS